MNSSPLRANDHIYSMLQTPTRKPTAHHCNAERKVMPYVNITQSDFSSASRNLFGNYDNWNAYNMNTGCNAKLFRWE